jgi:hypothetical protein
LIFYKKSLHYIVKGDKISRHFTRDGIFQLSKEVKFTLLNASLLPETLNRCGG